MKDPAGVPDPLVMGGRLGSIAARRHVVPASGPVLAGIEEQQHAFGICAPTDTVGWKRARTGGERRDGKANLLLLIRGAQPEVSC